MLHVFERLLPHRVVQPVDENAAKAALDESRRVTAEVRQFQLEREMYRLGQRKQQRLKS